MQNVFLDVAESCMLRKSADPDQEILNTDANKQSRLRFALKWAAIRKKRDQILGADLFADPAWDILLKVYIDRETEQQSSITDISSISGSSHTTIAAWLLRLEERALISRLPYVGDKRRILVELTPKGAMLTEQLLDQNLALMATERADNGDLLPFMQLQPELKSYSDIAEAVLTDHCLPLQLIDLSAAVLARRSTKESNYSSFSAILSRDSRFVNLSHNGKRYWWLSAYPVPLTWNP